MKKIITLLAIILLTASFQKAKASHIAGGDISYVCLGGNQYQIYLNLFVDCLGFDPGAAQTINFTSTCGGTATATVNVTNPGGTEISQLCPSALVNSTCSGGTLPGMWVFHFEGIVTLAPPCDTWTMSWTVCCRNAAIVNLVTPASFGSYIEATLNSVTDPCNNSPAFTAQPIPYVCQGQLVNYNYGVVETDGDSLYYSLIGAMDAGATPLVYSAGYSATSPIPGIAIDPNTGTLTFTPMTLGNFVVVVLVQEYDSAGNLLGTTMRDIQFIVQSCSNVVPDPAPTSGVIASLTGAAVQTGPYSLEMCEGDSFTFNAVYTDANPGDSLTIISNILAVMPGATITVTGTNPLTVTISWTAPGGSAGTNTIFSVTVNDGACPVPGQQIFVYDVNVQPRTLGGPDRVLCGPQTATMAGTGGSIFNWAVISGPPMVVGTNFSCNPCANPVASPVSTTVYEVTSDLSGTCVNKDTVTITIVPDFSFTTTQSASTTCLLQPIALNVNASPAGVYTYSWSPATYLSSTTVANPVANIPTPGVHTYVVTVTSPLGCIKTDTIAITITPNFPPNSVPFVSDNAVCDGETVNLGVTFGSSVPATCGLTSSGPCPATITTTVGTGTLSSANYPTPFPSFWNNGRIQILYTAAELTALGVTGGKISSVAFNVVTKGSTQPFNGFTIKMMCTTLTTLPNVFQAGGTTVYGPTPVTTTMGWNTYNFPTAYEWDGVSNIIVEVCYNNTSWTNNDFVQRTLTAFNSVVHQYQDITAGCISNAPTSYTERPNIRITGCGAVADSSVFTYAWSPTPLGSPSSQFTSATVNSTTTYTVVVTNSVSGCADTSSITVTSSSPTVSFTASPTTGFYPLTVNFTGTTSSGVTGIIWNFGDTLSGAANTSTFTNPTHVYNVEGNYTVTVIVTDANGCTDTATATIDVFGTSVVFVPNVFTPGGTNPQFVVTGFALTSYSIEIYNRWGKRVFESTDIMNSWDGNNVEDGTYFYIIKATGQDAKDYNLSGFVQRIGGR